MLRKISQIFIGNVAIKALTIVSIPILTRLLSKEDYGLIIVTNSWTAIFSILISLNLYSAISRNHYDNPDNQKKIVGTIYTVLFFLVVVFSLLAYFFLEPLAKIVALKKEVLVVVLLLALTTIIYELYLQIAIPKQKSKQIMFLSSGRAYGSFLFGILFVFLFSEKSAYNYLVGSLVLASLLSGVLLVKSLKDVRFGIDRASLKFTLHYALPLLPYSLSGILIEQVSRLIINHSNGLAVAADYSIAYNIGSLVSIVTSSIQVIFIPYFYSKYKEENKEVIEGFWKNAILFVAAAGVGIIFFSKEAIFILAGEKYLNAVWTIPVIVIGYFFYQIYFVYAVYIDFTKKVIILSISIITTGLINVVGSYYAISLFGPYYASFVTLLSYFILGFIVWALSKFYLKMQVVTLRIFISPLLLICVAAMAIELSFYPGFNLLYLFIKFGIYMLIITSLVLVWKFRKKNEKRNNILIKDN